MKNNTIIPMNLQYFAEDGEDNVSQEAVDLETEGDLDESEPEEEGAEEEEGENAEPANQPDHVQTAEEDANYARIRRKAEADARTRYEKQQSELDTMFAQMFSGYVNPETGQPIRSAADYIAAMSAQERQQAESKMAEAGIDKDSLNRLIENNPAVIQAKQAIQSINEQNAERMIREDMENILAIDPSIGSIENVGAAVGYAEAVQYTIDHPGIRLSDAYKIVNFDRLASSKTATAKQAAINAQRSKAHLSQTAGITTTNSEEEIPSSEIEKWREWFPDKSMKELKKLYNKTTGG